MNVMEEKEDGILLQGEEAYLRLQQTLQTWGQPLAQGQGHAQQAGAFSPSFGDHAEGMDTPSYSFGPGTTAGMIHGTRRTAALL